MSKQVRDGGAAGAGAAPATEVPLPPSIVLAWGGPSGRGGVPSRG